MGPASVLSALATAVDPRLEPLRNYYRLHAYGQKGLEAARLITEGIASHSPLGNPSQEFVDTGFDPVASFLLQLGGEPGHCVTRSGSVAAVLLASGIPARVFQIMPLDPDGRLGIERSQCSGSLGRAERLVAGGPNARRRAGRRSVWVAIRERNHAKSRRFYDISRS